MQKIKVEPEYRAKYLTKVLDVMSHFQENGMDYYAGRGAAIIADYLQKEMGIKDARVAFTKTRDGLFMTVFEKDEEMDAFVDDRLAAGISPLIAKGDGDTIEVEKILGKKDV